MAGFQNKLPFQANGNTQQPPLKPILFNPWILRNPTVEDIANYGLIKPNKEYLEHESFSLSNNNFRHWKMIDILDEQEQEGSLRIPVRCLLAKQPVQ